MWSNDTPALATLLPALVAHLTLAVLTIRDNPIPSYHLSDADVEAKQDAAGVLLAALLLANAPALTSLDVSFCNLGAAGMTRLASALPGNTHLRALYCANNIGTNIRYENFDLPCFGYDNVYATESAIMLPAVLANTSLRSLDSLSSWACEVEQLLRSRAAAGSQPSPAEALVERRNAAYLHENGRLEALEAFYRA